MTMTRNAMLLVTGLSLAAFMPLGGCASVQDNNPRAKLPLNLPTDGADRPSMVARDGIGTLIYRDKPGGIAHDPDATPRRGAPRQEMRLSTMLEQEYID